MMVRINKTASACKIRGPWLRTPAQSLAIRAICGRVPSFLPYHLETVNLWIRSPPVPHLRIRLDPFPPCGPAPVMV